MVEGDGKTWRIVSAAAPLRAWLRREPLFVSSLAAVAAILLADRATLSSDTPIHGWLLAVMAGLALLKIWRRFPPSAAALLLLGLGFAALHGHRIWVAAHHPLAEALAKSSPHGLRVQGDGRIAGEPTPVGTAGLVEEVRLVTVVEPAEPGPETLSPSEVTVLLRVSRGAVQAGDHVSFEGRLRVPESPRNPGAFDRATLLRRHGLIGILNIGPEDRLEVLSNRNPVHLELAARCREAVARAITQDLPPESLAAAILQAMTLGMRDRIPAETEAQFRNSGTLHLFAVSGLHVGMVAFIAWLLLKPLGLSRTALTMILIPVLFFYALVTGWRPSAVRASTMASVFLAGQCLLREPRILNSLGLAALVILLFDSQQVFLLGFQLSFSVLVAIVLLTGPLQRPWQNVLQPDPMRPMSLVAPVELRAYAIRRWASGLIAVSVAAWIGSLPYMIWVFHQVTPAALLANPLLVPLAFLVLFAAALSVLCTATSVMTWAAVLLNNANWAITQSMLALTGVFADLPGSHFAVSGRLPWTRPPLEITVLDLPKGGSAIHVHRTGHASELIDTGNLDSRRWVVLPYLKQDGQNRIDRLWLTHGDVAHIGGAADWLRVSRPPAVYRPPWSSRSPSLRQMQNDSAAHGIMLSKAKANDTFHLGPNMHWKCLYPPENEAFAPSLADDRGLVLLLQAPPWRVLLLSDAGFHTEQWLIQNHPNLDADVVIKDHHRSDWSGSASFLAFLEPRIVIWDSDSTGMYPASPEPPLSKAPVFLDQAQTGAVRLQFRQDCLTAQGFCDPQEEVTLKRAR